MLPSWFKMKKEPNDSMGLQFLNAFGLQLDEIEDILNYAYKQTNLSTIDINFVDILYKAMIPSNYDVDYITDISVDSTVLIETNDLYNFFDLDNNYSISNNINQNNYFFFDRVRKIIYLREPYDKDNTYLNGKVKFKINDENIIVPLVIHHVWNFLDEFGALFGCKRLYGEQNLDYKNRLLDIFVNKANSSKVGLANGISRELGLRRFKIWHNQKEEFIIKDNMVIVNSISKNGEKVEIEDLYVNQEGYVVLKAVEFDAETDVKISYICGLEINSLTNSISNKFSNETYNADGTPTDTLISYVNEIKNNSSILWNDFYYDEELWVKDNSEFDDEPFSFIPSTLDSSIKGFARYGFSKTNR